MEGAGNGDLVSLVAGEGKPIRRAAKEGPFYLVPVVYLLD